MTLSPASGLILPDDFAGKRAAIIARSGRGKTYTASVLAEEMVEAGQPFYALDPTGAWWGLRAAADGRRAGLPVIVIGGEHGDLPLPPDGGAAIADLVAHEPSFYVIDMSELGTRGAEVRFATAFLERLYRTKSRRRDRLHGFWDEADLFAPQRSGPDEARMLGAAEQVVRRGRIRGLGETLITQRPAVLNKNVLSQIDVLFALVVGDPLDRRAIKAWLDGSGDASRRDEVLDSLASLGLGEAWVYAPAEVPAIYQRVQIRERRTFNSSAAGEGGAEPATLADVDVAGARERLAALIESATAEDPRVLLERIAGLRERNADLVRQLAARPPEPDERIVVPAEVGLLADRLGGDLDAIASFGGELISTGERLSRVVERARPNVAALRQLVDGRPVARPTSPAAAPKSTNPSRASSPPPAAGGGHPPARQRILDMLAWFAEVGIPAPRRAALAPMAGTKATSGGFKNNLGALRSAGLVDYPEPNRVMLTSAGRGEALAPDIGRTPAQLQAAVIDLLAPARARILEVLIDAYPAVMSREVLAESVGVPATSGGFKNNLGALRTQELIDYPQPGTVAALPVLFLEGR